MFSKVWNQATGSLAACLVIAAALVPAPLLAQDQPSSKAAVSVGNVNLISGPRNAGSEDGAWSTIMVTHLKSSSQKDLICGVALECGLFTATTVRSKAGTSDTSSATSKIEIRVLIDGKPAQPGNVIFAGRRQELSATFQGLLNGALSIDPLTGAVIIDEALLTPEQVSLLQETMQANYFNFVLTDVGTGVHTIEAQARVSLAVAYQTGEATAKATVGKGTLTVEEVRLIKGADVAF